MQLRRRRERCPPTNDDLAACAVDLQRCRGAVVAARALDDAAAASAAAARFADGGAGVGLEMRREVSVLKHQLHRRRAALCWRLLRGEEERRLRRLLWRTNGAIEVHEALHDQPTATRRAWELNRKRELQAEREALEDVGDRRGGYGGGGGAEAGSDSVAGAGAAEGRLLEGALPSREVEVAKVAVAPKKLGASSLWRRKTLRRRPRP